MEVVKIYDRSAVGSSISWRESYGAGVETTVEFEAYVQDQ